MPLTSFVAREHEVLAVGTLLRRADVRLVTLTGPGGVGKTRLALRTADVLRADFDVVLVIPLGPVRDPELVLPTVARQAGLHDPAVLPVTERLRRHFDSKRVLLVLDNFEQVLAAATEVAALLTASPAAKALATSRALLHVAGEHAFPVLPLAVPPPAALPPADELPRYAAVRLFLDRARAVRPDFALTEANAATIAALCHRLEGLPLAIELAVAWLRIFPPAALLARLERRLPLLTGGPADQPERLRTMRDAIAWSYDLLPAEEQALFRRLAVFAGGFVLEAAERMMQDGGRGIRDGDGTPAPSPPACCPSPLDVVGGIASLLDTSLLRLEPGVDEEPRFGMMETIREFALERLAASGEAETRQRTHAAYFLSLAEAAEAELGGPKQAEWLDRLECERANLRAALGWTLVHAPAWAVRLASALWWFWHVRGDLSEGREWLDRALTVGTTGPPSVRASALYGAGMLAWLQGDYTRAAVLLEESLALSRALGNRRGTAGSLNLLGVLAENQGDRELAAALYEESLALYREVGDTTRTAWVLHNLGSAAQGLGDLRRGAALYDESLALFRQLKDKQGTAWVLIALADVALAADRRRATSLYRESLGLLQELEDKRSVAVVLERIAAVAATLDRPELAVRLTGAAGALRDAIGAPASPIERASLERQLAVARQRLGDDAFAAALAAGQVTALDQAIGDALTWEPTGSGSAESRLAPCPPALVVPPPLGLAAARHGLTPRELDVLGLLAAGYSNQAIADALFVGRSTVKTHVTGILAKLGVDSRAAAAALAHRHRLVGDGAPPAGPGAGDATQKRSVAGRLQAGRWQQH